MTELNHPALKKILAKTGVPDLIEKLADSLSPGELSSLLLEVYRQKIAKLRPADLLASLPQNRFVAPSALDPLVLKEGELDALKLAVAMGFQPVELGPVTPLGSSAVYGRINQNNVLSALRNCEVIADPSNLLCLLMTSEQVQTKATALHWICSHRTLRTAWVEGPGRYAHFQMLAACSLLQTRELEPLIEAVLKHLVLQKALFQHFGLEDMTLKFWLKSARKQAGLALWECLQSSGEFEAELQSETGSDYYQGFQIKTYARLGEHHLELADCGLVPWAAELKGDKHLNALISGVGLERILMFA